jgi:universal stress protein E
MCSQISRLAVGIGLLGKNDPVLNIAVRIARDVDAELHAVHAYDPPAPVDVVYAQHTGVAEDVPCARRRTIEQQLQAHVGEVVGRGERVYPDAVVGSPSECLVERAEALGAQLLIVGATRQDRIQRSFLGTTAQAVISHATMPVLLIRQPVVRPLKRVLFTTNLSEISTAVCRTGIEVLRTLFDPDHAELRCLLVIRSHREVADPEDYHDFAHGELMHLLYERVPALASAAAIIRGGEPAECIVREAAEWRPDLLVLGNHAYPGRVVGMGNVAGVVLREAARNVLMIPAACAKGAGST